MARIRDRASTLAAMTGESNGKLLVLHGSSDDVIA
jgi:hypothetical protein